MHEQLSLLDKTKPIDPDQLGDPSGYKGLYAFHKYWGKKPHELLAFIVQRLTAPGALVIDPFVGSGTAAREAILHKRHFIGCDINPIACALTRVLLSPPRLGVVTSGFAAVSQYAKEKILDTYRLSEGRGFASHYLWDGPTLKSVWQSNGSRIRRTENAPTEHDITLAESFKNYVSSLTDPPFYNNSRINADESLTLRDLFTGRALHNIDLLLRAIETLDVEQRDALKLCLTAASGQMSNMVFAVTNRGKTRGEQSSKVEVGSWVIGYWRPTLHFEVNAWNCFTRRTDRLTTALSTADPLSGTKLAQRPDDVLSKTRSAYVACMDCRRLLSTLPDRSVDLIITDPPHSDRIPYLELSAMWNALWGCPATFEQEIVVSDAKGRGKTPAAYSADVQAVLSQLGRVLRPTGFMVFLFNARNSSDWVALKPAMEMSSTSAPLRYVGCFPAQYSAGSVVQDNREGGLKHDYALVFSGSADLSIERRSALMTIGGWSSCLPPNSVDQGIK
jgi:hypothetical protein